MFIMHMFMLINLSVAVTNSKAKATLVTVHINKFWSRRVIYKSRRQEKLGGGGGLGPCPHPPPPPEKLKSRRSDMPFHAFWQAVLY